METYPSDADIFEHGILVESTGSSVPLNRVASTRLPIYSGYTLCVIYSNSTSLNDRAVRLFVPAEPHAVADFLEEGDLRYCLLAMLYHMNHLVDLYVAGCRIFETDPRIRFTRKGNISDPRIFYEIDALLTVARRVYESVRKVLWKYYMPGSKGRWRSIKNALESDRIPGDFGAFLNASWKSVGEDLAAYRDCLAHYDLLTDGAATCWMEPIAHRWGMTVKLPASPKSEGRGRHDYVLIQELNGLNDPSNVVIYVITDSRSFLSDTGTQDGAQLGPDPTHARVSVQPTRQTRLCWTPTQACATLSSWTRSGFSPAKGYERKSAVASHAR